jgi:hypothetical protein
VIRILKKILQTPDGRHGFKGVTPKTALREFQVWGIRNYRWGPWGKPFYCLITEAELNDLAHGLGDYLASAHWARIRLPGMVESHPGLIFANPKHYGRFRHFMEMRIRGRLYLKPKAGQRAWLKSELGPGFSDKDLRAIRDIACSPSYRLR